tara:strand:+ start:6577 stop:6951 length:375 start_codon:yes stop_codon:yes gene_type:complete
MRELVKTDAVPASTSPASLATKGAGMVCVSGQMPRDLSTGLIPADAKQQAELSLGHCLKVLEAAGSSKDKVMIVWVYVTDLRVKPIVNAVFRDVFGATPPARNLVAVKDIGDDALVEMSLIAIA